MNPRLIKFAVELQNCEKSIEKKKSINFLNINYKSFIKILKREKIAVIADE